MPNRIALGLALLLATLAGARGGAQPAPYHHYRTLATPHFNVHVAEGLEREGRVAAAAAERAYALLARELVAPRGTIDLVVSDDADYSNGFATPFPTNRIVVFATPPIESTGLRLNDDWLEVVVTHELTHIFHLDRARGVWAVAQRVFGRAPFLFPNVYGPAWLTEGLAVYYETRLTGGGRLRDAQSAALIRASALEGRLPRLDELSLGSPRFPGGEGAYAYGSRFVDYLAHSRDSGAIGRFVERQSGLLLPLWIDRAAVQGFGTPFGAAYARWRDSIMRAAGPPVPPLAGWRELTTHGFYASSPRWLNDTTLVYAGSDGREALGAYTVTTSGARARIGRRFGRGANVPLADGGLLYAQVDYVGTDEARSDLYIERAGHVTRLTHGARLVQPDARRDGAIVAVRLGPARSGLVLLDAAGTAQRVLREAAPDEAWSEPRWSPDGGQVAAIRRVHGGEFSLEVIDVATSAARVLDRGRFVLSSPSWRPDGTSVLYTSDESGSPQLAIVDPREPAPRRTAQTRDLGGTALFTPEVAPNERLVAATTLRADGFHVGVADAGALVLPRTETVRASARADSEPLYAGEFHEYASWRSLAPAYFYPAIDAGAPGGTRLGLTTSGYDVLRRHLYAAYAGVPVSGRYAVGALSYRYAGWRRPYLDVSLVQDWTNYATLVDGAGNRGTLLKSTQDFAVSATLARPRVRTYSSLSGGLGVERRHYTSDPASLLTLVDSGFRRSYVFPRVFVSGSFSRYERPPLSISPEDGITLGATLRERLRADAAGSTASASVTGAATAYKSLDLPGFAHHVLALRVAGGLADRRAGTAYEVGGVSGNAVEVVPGYTVGEGRRTFGVRGFPSASTYGTAAATGALEYRAPLVLGGRGLGVLPLFFDRSSITAFADAGVATCHDRPLFPDVCAPSPLIGRTIASVGGELTLSASILEWDAPQSLRFGVAVPVAGRELVQAQVAGVARASVYVAFGLSY